MTAVNNADLPLGDEIIRPTAFEPLSGGIMKLAWPSGAIATLTINVAVAGRRMVSFEIQEDGSAISTEATFAECFSVGGDGEWDSLFLARLCKEQGQPFE